MYVRLVLALRWAFGEAAIIAKSGLGDEVIKTLRQITETA